MAVHSIYIYEHGTLVPAFDSMQIKSDLAIKHRKNLLIAGAKDCKEHMIDRGM
jgi:hypothetical protein